MKAKTVIKAIIIIAIGCGSVLVGIKLYFIDATYRQQNVEQDKPQVEDQAVFKKVEEVLPELPQDNTDKGDLGAKYNKAVATAPKAIGWVYVPKTNVNYPIMHGDNNYYLNRTWDDKSSADGAIFLDQNCNGFSPVSLIHGHNMASGSMFATLQVFYNNGTIMDDDIIYVYDGKKEVKYKIFSIFRTDPNIQIKLSLTQGNDLKDYAQQLKDKSHSSSSYQVNEKPLMVLNTCCSDGTGEHFLVIGQQMDN